MTDWPTNPEYPPLPAVDETCPKNYAYDASEDRCVSLIGWCEGALWTCKGEPARHDHPQFICNPAFPERPQRCCRAGWPPEPGSASRGRCWRWKPRRID
jgi:hypothetical protein